MLWLDFVGELMHKWKVDRKWEEAGRPHDNGDFVKILFLEVIYSCKRVNT